MSEPRVRRHTAKSSVAREVTPHPPCADGVSQKHRAQVTAAVTARLQAFVAAHSGAASDSVTLVREDRPAMKFAMRMVHTLTAESPPRLRVAIEIYDAPAHERAEISRDFGPRTRAEVERDLQAAGLAPQYLADARIVWKRGPIDATGVSSK